MTKFNSTTLAVTLALGLLSGCNDSNTEKEQEQAVNVRFATFNLSFDRTAAGMLSGELALTREAQDALLARFNAQAPDLTSAEITQAKNVQQIRNVTEIIQRTRPDVFVLNEFDNDGKGGDITDLKAFNNNYLAHAQHAEVKPITYPVMHNFATNTGLMSGMDLNNDGEVNKGADDAWGYGNYHGQYAFAMLSKYSVDESAIRTFQNFKWKDMPGEMNPIIDDCNNPKAQIPANRQCGDAWYSADAWAEFPLSSKNHVDVPVTVKVGDKEQVIHFLLSHPTPPIFGNAARHNLKHNRAEVNFWNHYINGESYMVDDKGTKGGLAKDAMFIIAGDLNADPEIGDGDLEAIKTLHRSALVNQDVSEGYLRPVSLGGPECLVNNESGTCNRNNDRSNPERITSSSGLLLDHILPSANLDATASGVFWPASHEAGYHLVYGIFDGKPNVAKSVSSDHRLVWVDVELK